MEMLLLEVLLLLELLELGDLLLRSGGERDKLLLRSGGEDVRRLIHILLSPALGLPKRWVELRIRKLRILYPALRIQQGIGLGPDVVYIRNRTQAGVIDSVRKRSVSKRHFRRDARDFHGVPSSLNRRTSRNL